MEEKVGLSKIDYEHHHLLFDDIMEEREYQCSKWSNDNDLKNTPSDWVCFITAYLGKAYAFAWDKENFRKCLVKVCALCFAAIQRLDANEMAKRHWD
jgi:hypothetical protein